MDGILIIDKPETWTSHDVVGKLRKLLKTKRIGHTGTLDPFATGVLVIMVGKATKLAQFLDKATKEYTATMRFGFETDTGDLTGTPKSEIQIAQPFTSEQLQKAFSDFIGFIYQTPPMYSAKKVQGKKLYELARQGIEIERKAVCKGIYGLESMPNENGELYALHDDGTFDLKINVTCEAGTYIRTLAEDIAKNLGSLAHLTELRRTRAGDFSIEQAVKIEDSENAKFISMNEALSHLPQVKLSAEEIKKVRNGMKLPSNLKAEFVRLTDAEDNLIAIGTANENFIQPKIVFV